MIIKDQTAFSYLPVDIHFMWQMTFDFDIFWVLVRSCRKEGIWILSALLVEEISGE